VPGEARDDQAVFERFVEEAGPRLGRALAALYGFEDGRDATAEALAYAWETWPRLQHIANLPGCLFRVGQTRSRRRRQPVAELFDIGEAAITASSPACPGHLPR
jgi:DNA-directed RNA polymerase specialized sigma24 family protein